MIKHFLMLILFGMNSGVEASEVYANPREVVSSATTEVMKIVQEANGYYEEDPERYYEAIGALLDELVDFRGFTRGVMGRYATLARYKSLDKDGRRELKNQLDRFSAVVRENLVRTYSKGLLAFGGAKTEVDSSSDPAESEKTATVRQLIYGERAEPFKVVYQMRLMKNKQWKLRNISVEDINLGLIYRNQFESAVAQADGDLNHVISNWNLQ